MVIPAPRTLPPTLEFMRLLWGVDHALQRRSKRMEAELGVTGPQRLAVRLVARFPRISPSDLAETLRLHRSTVTGVLQRLEERGFVRRAADPRDGRRARLELTAKGRSLDALSKGTMEASVRRALARLSAADVDGAARVLAALTEELGREDR